MLVTATVAEEKSKSTFDEQTLDKLLEAAFVLQEHNRRSGQVAQQLERARQQIESGNRAAEPNNGAGARTAPLQGDYTVTLGRIVETQRQIQMRQLDLLSAMALVANRVVDVSGGSGAAIAVVDGQFVHYRAVAGKGAPAADSTVPAEKALCSLCVTTGQVFRCPDTRVDAELNKEECERRGIQSLIAAPVFLQGNVTGALELYFAGSQAFTDQDVHTCQLMAGLVTEALVRDEEATWKKSLASERAAMLEALEKLQPNLAALVEKPTHDHPPALPERQGSTTRCRRCGHELLASEQFCGECGAPQMESAKMVDEVVGSPTIKDHDGKHEELDPPVLDAIGTGTPSELESPSLEMPPADLLSEALAAHSSAAVSAEGQGEEETVDFEQLLHAVEEGANAEDLGEETTPEEDERTSDSAAIQKLTRPADWSSAAAAKDFLEQLAGKKGSASFAEFWNARRGDIYLAISVILVICVIVWGLLSNHPVDANGTQGSRATAHSNAPDANLSFSDRLLIRLGLAEAPEPAEDKGNPATQVWVDQRTALYYCPGSDLYEKTPKGKFMSQRDAQLDQFEPAYRKPCN